RAVIVQGAQLDRPAVVQGGGDRDGGEGGGLREVQVHAHPALEPAVVGAAVMLGGPVRRRIAVGEAVLLIGVVRVPVAVLHEQFDVLDLRRGRSRILRRLRGGFHGRLAGLLLLGGGRGGRCRGGQGVIQQLAHIARDRGEGDDEGDHYHDGTADDDPLRLQRALLPVPRAHRERPAAVV